MISIILQGGIVQAVVDDELLTLTGDNVQIIDYDIKDQPDDEVSTIVFKDGSEEKALAYPLRVTQSEIKEIKD